MKWFYREISICSLLLQFITKSITMRLLPTPIQQNTKTKKWWLFKHLGNFFPVNLYFFIWRIDHRLFRYVNYFRIISLKIHNFMNLHYIICCFYIYLNSKVIILEVKIIINSRTYYIGIRIHNSGVPNYLDKLFFILDLIQNISSEFCTYVRVLFHAQYKFRRMF